MEWKISKLMFANWTSKIARTAELKITDEHWYFEIKGVNCTFELKMRNWQLQILRILGNFFSYSIRFKSKESSKINDCNSGEGTKMLLFIYFSPKSSQIIPTIIDRFNLLQNDKITYEVCNNNSDNVLREVIHRSD